MHYEVTEEQRNACAQDGALALKNGVSAEWLCPGGARGDPKWQGSWGSFRGQFGFQGCIKKSAVAILGNYIVRSYKFQKFRNYLGFFCPFDAVDREHLELEVIWIVMVRQEQYL